MTSTLPASSARPARVARGLAVGSLATFAALLAHVTAGGSVPVLLGVLVPWMLAVAACTTLAARRWSLLRLIIGVAIAHVTFHALFTLGATGVPPLVLGGAAHSHLTLGGLPTASASSGAPEVGMLLAHGAVVAMTVVLVAVGGRVLRRARIAADRVLAHVA